MEAERLEPANASEVLRAVRTAAVTGRRVRAVGAGHSSSDVAMPSAREQYIDVGRLAGRLPDWPYYRGDLEHPERFVRVGAGTTIAEINRLLAPPPGSAAEQGRALYNMGNYDGQTIAGAFSTGTHGSGLMHGTIADRVVAIEMVTDERHPHTGERVQRLLRLERSPASSAGVQSSERGEAYGISISAEEFLTRRTRSTDPVIRQMELEQDSDVFDAALINLGCFGVIVGVTVETSVPFDLEETNTMEAWQVAREPGFLRRIAVDHDEFLQLTLVPHRVQDAGPFQHQIMVRRTVRERLDYRPDHVTERALSREDTARCLSRIFSTGRLEESVLADPQRGIDRVRTTFLQQASTDPWRSRSDLVLINSLAPEVAATSIDIQVPFEHAERALDRIIELAEQLGHTAQGDDVGDTWWHTSPLGIRFVGQSRALIAPTFDGPRVSIEIPLLYDLSEGPATRARHERYRNWMMQVLEGELTDDAFGGRPHWGQRNWMTGQRARHMYGENWDRWVEVYRRFNAYQTFSNRFTLRMGLDRPPRVAACRTPPIPADGAPAPVQTSEAASAESAEGGSSSADTELADTP